MQLKSFSRELALLLLGQIKKDDIDKTIKSVQELFDSEAVIVKAQIHAGGRGKGGGIKYCKGYHDAVIHSNNILGMQLITPQTSKEGKRVNQVLIFEDVYSPREFEIRELIQECGLKSWVIGEVNDK